MSFLSQIKRSLLLSALLPIVAIGLGAIQWSEQILIDRTLFHLQSVAELQQARVRNLIERNLERFTLVASRTQLRLSLQRFQRDGDVDDQRRMKRIIADALRALPALERITVLARDGTVVASTQSVLQHDGDSPDLDLIRDEDSQPVFELKKVNGGRIVGDIAGPLVIDDETIGHLWVRMNVSDLQRIVVNYTGLGDSGETLLARRSADGGALFLTPTRFDPRAGLSRLVAGKATDVPMIRALAGHHQTFTDTVDYRGIDVLSATSFIAELGWGVVAKMDRAEVLSTIGVARGAAIAVLIATCAVVLLVTASLTRSFLRPMRTLLDAAVRVGRGDLSGRISLPGKSEFSELAAAFNKMSVNLAESSACIEREIEHRRRVEQRFKRIIESAPTAMILCSLKGRIELVNLAAERLFGYAQDELVGQPIERLLPERFASAHPGHREAYVRSPATRAMGAGRDLAGRRKDGTEVPIEIGLNPIQTDEGAMVLSAIIDLTERRRFESDLLEKNKKLENEHWLKTGQTELANRMRRAATLHDLAESVLGFFCEGLDACAGAFYVCESGDALTLHAGYCLPEQAPGRVIARGEGLVGQAARDQQSRVIKQVPRGYLQVESALGASDPANLLLVPLVSGHRTLGVLEFASFSSFTARHEELLRLSSESIAISVDVMLSAERLRDLLEETRQKSRALEQANSYKSAFLANMSHELRTPLNSLLILARMLAENEGGRLSNEEQKSAAIIHRSGLSLLSLISDILDMSKIEAGKLDIAIAAVDVRGLVSEVVDQFTPLVEEAGLDFEVVVSDAVPERIGTDHQRLRQILVNLLSNAVKFTKHGGVTMQVSVEENSGELRFAVTDTGDGIAAEDQHDVFGAFYQADPSRTRSHGGTGLGLSISRQLAGLLGGDIGLRSTPGVGSTFTLHLPAGEAAAKPRTRESGSLPGVDPASSSGPPAVSVGAAITAPVAQPSGERVLVLGEDMRDAFELAGSLAESGIQAQISPSVEHARHLLETAGDFDAVLSCGSVDAQAHRAMARELTRLLGSPIPAPFVVVGTQEPSLVESAGPDACVVLPRSFTVEHLRAALRMCVTADAQVA